VICQNLSGNSCIFYVTDVDQKMGDYKDADEKVADEKDDVRRELFSQKMRAATRNIHNKSDALVNAKLGVTMSDDNVWAEGLLVFYEIFKFLEDALASHSDSLIGDLLIPGMARTHALEADLAHYLGDGWKDDYVVRPEVSAYVDHLKKLDDENPYLLIPYIYHLYMGLFSGGQVLRATRMLTLSSIAGVGGEERPGNSVTSYNDNITIGSLKKQLRKAINDLADELDEEIKEAILVESVSVFEWNNHIIGSVKGVDSVLRRRLLKLLIAVLLLLLFLFAYIFHAVSDIEVEGDVFSLETGDKPEL